MRISSSEVAAIRADIMAGVSSSQPVHYSTWIDTKETSSGYYQVRIWQSNGIVVGQEWGYVPYSKVVWG